MVASLQRNLSAAPSRAGLIFGAIPVRVAAALLLFPSSSTAAAATRTRPGLALIFFSLAMSLFMRFAAGERKRRFCYMIQRGGLEEEEEEERAVLSKLIIGRRCHERAA